MKLTISRKGLILVSIPLLFQLLFILLVARMQQRNAEAQQLSAHSQEVIDQVHTMLADLLAAESSLHGYLLTGKRHFYQEYRGAAGAVPDQTQRLAALVEDNPDQHALAAQIRAQAARLLKWFEGSAALVPGMGPKTIKARVNDPAGRALLEGLRADTARFLAAEERLEHQRALDLEETRGQLYAVLLAGGLALCLSAAVLAGMFAQHHPPCRRPDRQRPPAGAGRPAGPAPGRRRRAG